jgi:hypothetical protein
MRAGGTFALCGALWALASCSPMVPARCPEARFDAPVSSYGFSPAERLATLHADGVLRVWHLAERRLLAETPIDGSPVRAGWLDGDTLVVDGERGLRVVTPATGDIAPAAGSHRLLETSRGVEVLRGDEGGAELITALGAYDVAPASAAAPVAFAPDGSASATLSRRGRALRVWRSDGTVVAIARRWIFAGDNDVELAAGGRRLMVVNRSISAEGFAGVRVDVFDLDRAPVEPLFHWVANDHHGTAPQAVLLSHDGTRVGLLQPHELGVHDSERGGIAWVVREDLRSAAFGPAQLVAERVGGGLLVFGAERGEALGAMQRCPSR